MKYILAIKHLDYGQKSVRNILVENNINVIESTCKCPFVGLSCECVTLFNVRMCNTYSKLLHFYKKIYSYDRKPGCIC